MPITLILLFLATTFGQPIEAQATWIHKSLDGGAMYNSRIFGKDAPGTIFDSNNTETIAVAMLPNGQPAIPMGTWLLVCNDDVDFMRCAIGEVRDTGRFAHYNLDLAWGMYKLLGNPEGRPINIRYWKFGNAG